MTKHSILLQNHPFHLVTPRPWPILISFTLFNILIITIKCFHKLNYSYSLIFLNLILCTYQWWRDIIREATYQGHHTLNVYKAIRLGIILFIISEIIFFFSFFWAYFHSFLSPSTEIGQLWPPSGVSPFHPFDIPLLNTIILITSGLSVTWRHQAMININFKECKKRLILTILLGVYFTRLQLIEYHYSYFTFVDSIYGNVFFISTGFHGIHVIIGTIFLFYSYIRLKSYNFSSVHHFGLEAAIWYWHFVDIVWLFL